jgi:hypothetical protein
MPRPVKALISRNNLSDPDNDLNEEDLCQCQHNDCPIHGSIDPQDHEEILNPLFPLP